MEAAPDTSEERLAAGREALARGEWEVARDHLLVATGGAATAEALEALSWAAWWLSDEALTLDSRERAYRAYRDAGSRCAAARMAVWLGSDLFDFRGEHALATGWLERAARLLEDAPRCREHGWLWLIQADLLRRGRDDPGEVERLAGDIVRLGRELGSHDLETIGLALEGVVRVERGDVDHGMRLLGEASALATAEEFELPLVPGWAMCFVVSACVGIGDFPRADELCRVMRPLVERWGGRSLLGACRVAYGDVLVTGGDWPAAEAELAAAIDDYEASRRAMAAAGRVRLADLRLRQGRRDEARELFMQARPHAAALLGIGRIALEEGDARGAADAAERVLRRLDETLVLERVPAIELLVRAHVAAGELEDAVAAAHDLAEAAAGVGTTYLAARAQLVRAELFVAAGDHEAGRRAAEDALDALLESAAPYEAALARLVLARALAELGRAGGAAAEARAARAEFVTLGASPSVAAADALLASVGGSDGGGPSGAGNAAPDSARLRELTARELDVLRLVAQGLSDAEVAERLVLSPHTVHRHMANVRTKLALPSRSAAVAYAARAGVL